jgi:hypothetical protein
MLPEDAIINLMATDNIRLFQGNSVIRMVPEIIVLYMAKAIAACQW